MEDQLHKKRNGALPFLLIAFLAGIALCVMAFRTGLQYITEGYFLGALIAVSIPVGALGVRLIYALTGGKWAAPLERYFVSASRLMPLALLLWVPVLLWLPHIYPWARPNAVTADPDIASKAAYLSVPFFVVRSVLYFILWTAAVWWLDRFNRKTDLSGLLSVVYFLAGTFAAMDWVMSLVPRWYSTVFGAMFVTGQVLLAFCFAVMVNGFSRQAPPAGGETDRPAGIFIDQGSLILTMVMFWAYLAFSQLLIIWMGIMPHEISWYLRHIRNGWDFMAPVVIAGHLFLPLFLLLKREWKASPAYLASVALLVILMRAGDVAWMVFSGLPRPAGALTAAHAGAAAAVISLYLIVWLWQAQRSEQTV
jgi:hypothetical protein